MLKQSTPQISFWLTVKSDIKAGQDMAPAETSKGAIEVPAPKNLPISFPSAPASTPATASAGSGSLWFKLA